MAYETLESSGPFAKRKKLDDDFEDTNELENKPQEGMSFLDIFKGMQKKLEAKIKTPTLNRYNPIADTLQNNSIQSKPIGQLRAAVALNGFGPTNDKLPFKSVKHAETTKMDTDVKIRLQDTILIGLPEDEIQNAKSIISTAKRSGKSNLMKYDDSEDYFIQQSSEDATPENKIKDDNPFDSNNKFIGDIDVDNPNSDPLSKDTRDGLCIICDWDFGDLEYLANHVKEAHNYICEICSKEIKLSNNVQRHYKRDHSDIYEELVVCCRFCPTIFPNNSLLKDHLETVHGARWKGKYVESLSNNEPLWERLSEGDDSSGCRQDDWKILHEKRKLTISSLKQKHQSVPNKEALSDNSKSLLSVDDFLNDNTILEENVSSGSKIDHENFLALQESNKRLREIISRNRETNDEINRQLKAALDKKDSALRNEELLYKNNEEMKNKLASKTLENSELRKEIIELKDSVKLQKQTIDEIDDKSKQLDDILMLDEKYRGQIDSLQQKVEKLELENEKLKDECASKLDTMEKLEAENTKAAELILELTDKNTVLKENNVKHVSKISELSRSLEESTLVASSHDESQEKNRLQVSELSKQLSIERENSIKLSNLHNEYKAQNGNTIIHFDKVWKAFLEGNVDSADTYNESDFDIESKTDFIVSILKDKLSFQQKNTSEEIEAIEESKEKMRMEYENAYKKYADQKEFEIKELKDKISLMINVQKLKEKFVPNESDEKESASNTKTNFNKIWKAFVENNVENTNKSDDLNVSDANKTEYIVSVLKHRLSIENKYKQEREKNLSLIKKHQEEGVLAKESMKKEYEAVYTKFALQKEKEIKEIKEKLVLMKEQQKTLEDDPQECKKCVSRETLEDESSKTIAVRDPSKSPSKKQLLALKSEAVSINEMAVENGTINVYRGDVSTLEKANSSLETRLKEANAKIIKLEECIIYLQKQKDDMLEKKSQQLKTLVKGNKMEVKYLKDKISSLENDVKEATSQKEKPGSKLEKMNKAIDALQNDVKNAMEDKTTHETEIKALNAMNKSLIREKTNYYDKYVAIDAKYKTLKCSEITNNKAIKDLKKQHKELEDKLKDANSKIQNLQPKAIDSDKTDIEPNVALKQEVIDETEVLREKLRTKEKELKDMKIKANQFSSKIREELQQIKTITSQEEKQKLEELSKKVEALTKSNENYKTRIDALEKEKGLA